MSDQPTPAKEPTPFERLTAQIEINSLDLTQKLQAAVDGAINSAAQLDSEGRLRGFDFGQGRGERLRLISEAYYNVVAAEAARRTSMRPAVPNITLPPRETARSLSSQPPAQHDGP